MTGRPGFREWIDRHPDPGWGLIPLTHITGGIRAEDIARAEKVEPTECEVFNEPLAYFFYGRPAYRIAEEGAIKVEAACPFCFVFDSALINRAKSIFAFDTGAFVKRLYKRFMDKEMNVEDFSLLSDTSRPNKLIAAAFSSINPYLEGNTSKVADAGNGASPWEFHASAYLNLLGSAGRNEPDDRICSIEVVLGEPVPLAGNLKALVVPHTVWGEKGKAPWLEKLSNSNVEIVTYNFIPGRPPEHYHVQLETAVIDLYKAWGVI